MPAIGLVEFVQDIGQELLDLSIASDVGNAKSIEKEVVEDEWSTKEVVVEDLSATEINDINDSIVDNKDNEREKLMEQHIAADSKSKWETQPSVNKKVHVCIICDKIFATKK